MDGFRRFYDGDLQAMDTKPFYDSVLRRLSVIFLSFVKTKTSGCGMKSNAAGNNKTSI